ncbi:carboxymuconolactone decarboxylase family protein [Labrenzia sp. CE80]|uniref:carboxymuconolactone decarboxylase family protein n=1 Tax=Labrenzia sp. CE80 TaxID=1788986 RepID=UPI00336A6EA0
MGGQTGPQLRINIEAGLKVGLSETEIAEIIWQMALYGGLPAAINALNTLTSICEDG